MDRKTILSIATGIRLLLSGILLFMVYRETGIWTTIVLGFVLLSLETTAVGVRMLRRSIIVHFDELENILKGKQP